MRRPPGELAVAVRRYRLRFRSPLRTGAGVRSERHGAIVRLLTPRGAVGYGDIAPLAGWGSPGPDPATSAESLATAEAELLDRALAALAELIGALGDALGPQGPPRDPDGVRAAMARLDALAPSPGQTARGHCPTCGTNAPHGAARAAVGAGGRATSASRTLPSAQGPAISARGALSLALCDLAARRAGVALATWLCPGAPRAVAVNALVGALAPAQAAAEAEAALAAGYRTIKVKLGTGRAADLARINAVRSRVGDAVRIRGDANQAWDEHEAIVLLRELAAFDLELVEQPVPGDDVAALARVRRASPVPIAADEALATGDGFEQVLAHGAADAIILKPSLIGGPCRACDLAEQAGAVGLLVIVTHALESAVGRMGALHVAAALDAGRIAARRALRGTEAMDAPPGGSQPPARRSTDPTDSAAARRPIAPAHGLAPSSVLDGDVAPPRAASGGWMRLPDGHGLGVEIRGDFEPVSPAED